MKKVKLFEEYQSSDMVQEIHRIHGGELSEERINELINEGFFDWIKGIFMNPMKKRKLRQLGDKLVQIRVELGKLKIEQEQIEELKRTAIQEIKWDTVNNLVKTKEHQEFLLKLSLILSTKYKLENVE